MPKTLISLCVIALALQGCSENSSPVDVEVTQKTDDVIELTGRVVDEAGLLDNETENKLIKKLAMLEHTSGPQFVVVTVNSLNCMSIEDYGIRLGRTWQIGSKDRNDGVILLVAPNERKVRIEVGYGLEASLSDPFCAKVIRENILPEFRGGNIAQGIILGSHKLIKKLEQTPTLDLNDNDLDQTKEAQKSA